MSGEYSKIQILASLDIQANLNVVMMIRPPAPPPCPPISRLSDVRPGLGARWPNRPGLSSFRFLLLIPNQNLNVMPLKGKLFNFCEVLVFVGCVCGVCLSGVFGCVTVCVRWGVECGGGTVCGVRKNSEGKAATEGLCSDSFAYSAILYPAPTAVHLGGVFMKMAQQQNVYKFIMENNT